QEDHRADQLGGVEAPDLLPAPDPGSGVALPDREQQPGQRRDREARDQTPQMAHGLEGTRSGPVGHPAARRVAEGVAGCGNIAVMNPPEVLWSPPADARRTSRIGHYLGWLERHRGLTFADY